LPSRGNKADSPLSDVEFTPFVAIFAHFSAHPDFRRQLLGAAELCSANDHCAGRFAVRLKRFFAAFRL
jgi:hypothetical protein